MIVERVYALSESMRAYEAKVGIKDGAHIPGRNLNSIDTSQTKYKFGTIFT